MTDAATFWDRVEDSRSLGTIVCALLSSWKPVADQTGHAGADVASGVFNLLCGTAFESAEISARLSTTVFAAYWPDQQSEKPALLWLDRWAPMTLHAPRDVVVLIDVRTIVVPREPEEPAGTLFARVRRELEGVVAALPEGARYPPFL